MKSGLATWATLAVLTNASQSPVFRSGADLVAMQVTVTDADGRAVRGLTADAFQIFENDRPRTLAHFTQSAEPLNLVIDLDTSGSMAGARFVMARRAVTRLLEALRPDDRVAVLGFSAVPYQVADWTANRANVERALDAIHPHDDAALYNSVF